MTKIIKLIFTKERVGKGTTEDPVRKVYQLFTEDGELVCSHDPETMTGYTVGLEKISN